MADKGAKITLDEMIGTSFSEKRTRDGKPLKPSTVGDYAPILKYHFATWLDLPIGGIVKMLSPEVAIERYKKAGQDPGPFGARNAFTMLSAVLNHARLKYPATITSNPLLILRPGQHMRKIEAWDDRLEGADFRAFHDGIQGFNEITRDGYLLCLYQGLRSEETAGLRSVITRVFATHRPSVQAGKRGLRFHLGNVCGCSWLGCAFQMFIAPRIP
ncbi:hypothetical protein [Geobacter sp. AOG2]|uniref:hypothetical protein n=1 Tax=Geobacter sp. AOG2 TaxID=1566347 RepID=UPI001CC3E4EB|nr:hypothetical protein [Geobacter sp. AOG2]GFE59546.1 hypothetical protein AOG2_01340 [Geobacter sp. AOG2]